MTAILLFPFRLAAWMVCTVGRVVAFVTGLVLLGVGGFLCTVPLFVIVGLPMAVVGLILVVKAV